MAKRYRYAFAQRKPAKKGIFAIIYYDSEHLDRRNCGKERDGKSFKRQRPRDRVEEVRKKWKRI